MPAMAAATAQILVQADQGYGQLWPKIYQLYGLPQQDEVEFLAMD